MARNIIVASPATNKAKTISSNATTFGELKAEREFASIYNDGLEAIVGGSKTTLGRDDSALPAGEFGMFLVAKKNKAGAATLVASLNDQIEEAVEESDVLDYLDSEDIDNILAIVKSTIDTFFAAGIEAGMSAAEAKVLAESKKL